MALRICVLGFFLFLFCACHRPGGDDLFYPAKNLGKVGKKLDEASGLVSSVANPGKLWTLNDSGNDPEVYLINGQAKIETTYHLDKVENIDWEDIAIGAGPLKDVSYVYVGEIGDNKAIRDYKMVYRFAEPISTGKDKESILNFDTLVFKLPDHRRDTETMMVDPLSNDLFIISKREDSVSVYQAHYPFSKDTIVMENQGKIPYKLIVAGSISADGSEVLLKNYGKIYYWKRNAGEAIPDLLKREAKKLRYEPEHQGEAIAWSRDGSAFYTLSESSVADHAQLREYRKKK